jgi:hypothetical protein
LAFPLGARQAGIHAKVEIGSEECFFHGGRETVDGER